MSARGSRPVAVLYPDNLGALGVCRGLGARGIPVMVLSTDRASPGQYSRYARRVACPAGGADRVLACLDALGRAQPEPPVLFLTTDAAIIAFEPHRAALETRFRLPLPPGPVLRRLLLKDELYRELDGVVPVPRTRAPAGESELAEAGRAVGYPALVKPRLRCLSEGPGHRSFERRFGQKAVRVRDLGELTRAYRAARGAGFSALVQEEIEGPVSSLYSVGLCATRRGEVPAAFTSQKLGQVPAEFGDGLIVRAAHAPVLVVLGQRIVRHFGHRGLADIEFKWDARERVYKLLDVNPRPWLWINLATACGVNLPYAAYLEALGRPVDPLEFAQGDFQTRWLSVRGIATLLVRSLRHGIRPRDLGALLAGLRGPHVGPLLSREDLLVRMLVSPAYWRDVLREAARGAGHLRPVRQG